MAREVSCEQTDLFYQPRAEFIFTKKKMVFHILLDGIQLFGFSEIC